MAILPSTPFNFSICHRKLKRDRIFAESRARVRLDSTLGEVGGCCGGFVRESQDLKILLSSLKARLIDCPKSFPVERFVWIQFIIR